jgi:ribose transport system ATP-binding protein
MTTASPYALELRNISKQFPGVKALSAVALRVRPGEIHALVGENGAGKSTLLKILAGSQQPDAGGEILIAGKPVTLSSPKAAREAGIAMMHQELQLVPELDVAQNLFLGAPRTRFGWWLDHAAMRERAREVLRDLDPTLDVRLPVKALSVAQRQLVEIARALLADASVIAMDEPTSSLTPAEFVKLLALMKRLAQRGVAIIYVSHKFDEIYASCSHATVLRDGTLVTALRLADTPEPALVAHMVGREVVPTQRRAAQRQEVVLEARNLNWRGRVRNASLQVRRGEILGIAGLVGAGRTELVKLLAGAEQPESGEIWLHEENVRFGGPADAIARGIALVPEERKREGIVPIRSVLSNAALPSLRKLNRFGWVRHGLLKARIGADAQRVNLRPLALDRPIRLFSGGNQQKAIVCRWLSAGMDVLIFDEPTRGIDIGAKHEIYQLIEALAAEGRAIVVVSSDLPEVMRLSDRMLVMQGGRIAGELSDPVEFSEQAIMTLAVSRETPAH